MKADLILFRGTFFLLFSCLMGGAYAIINARACINEEVW